MSKLEELKEIERRAFDACRATNEHKEYEKAFDAYRNTEEYEAFVEADDVYCSTDEYITYRKAWKNLMKEEKKLENENA